MDDLIRFRARIESLTEDEFRHLLQSQPRQSITNVLFQFFRHQLVLCPASKYHAAPTIQEFNEQIDCILEARPQNEEELRGEADDDEEDVQIESARDQDLLSALPSVLISNISSWLSLTELAKLELCSRHILVGTRSPIPMRTMTDSEFISCLRYSNHHRTLCNWHKLKIENLTISTPDLFDVFDHKNFITFESVQSLLDVTKLKKLSINAYCINDEDVNLSDKFLSAFLNLSFPNVTAFRIDDHVFPSDIDIRRRMPRLQHLSLVFCEQFDASQVEDTLSSVQVQNVDLPLQSAECVKYRSIHTSPWQWKSVTSSEENKVWLSRLEEICVTQCLCGGAVARTERFADIFDIDCTLQNLKRLNLTMTEKRAFLSILEKTGERLEFVAVCCRDEEDVNVLLDALNEDMQRRTERRAKLKVKIVCSERTATKLETSRLIRLCEKLSAKTNDFMILLWMEKVEEELECIENALKQFHVVIEAGNRLIISNHACKINGYQERWLMQCEYCSADEPYC